MSRRKHLPVDLRQLCLHEAGYKCGNPVCRMVITLDVHHLDPISEDGGHTPENLLALCPNCHTLHHAGHIPRDSLRAWKMILLSLSEAYDRSSVDMLLTLAKIDGRVVMPVPGLLQCASLIASGLLEVDYTDKMLNINFYVSLSQKGKRLVEGWKAGRQEDAIGVVSAR
jgi:hypothetical protein